MNTTELGLGLPTANYTNSTACYAGGTSQTLFNNPYVEFPAPLGMGWNAGAYGTQWVQVDLGGGFNISGFHYRTGQVPNGITWQKVFVSDTPIGNSWAQLTPQAERSGYSNNGDVFNLMFNAPVTGRYLEVVANGGPSWTSLSNAQIIGQVPEPMVSVFLLLIAAVMLGRRKTLHV